MNVSTSCYVNEFVEYILQIWLCFGSCLLLPSSPYISICRAQNFVHNISAASSWAPPYPLDSSPLDKNDPSRVFSAAPRLHFEAGSAPCVCRSRATRTPHPPPRLRSPRLQTVVCPANLASFQIDNGAL
jgi:hypothetical protein